MMNNLNIKNIDIFKNNISTFSETSRNDTGKNILVDKDFICINFDEVKNELSMEMKKDYSKSINLDDPCSVDALVISKSGNFFIEFKDAKIDTKEKRKIIQKGKDSMVMFSNITDCLIKNAKKNSYFILVYSEENNIKKNNSEENNKKRGKSRIEIAETVSNYGKGGFVEFGINKLRGLYYNNVYTFNEKEFIKHIENSNIKHLE